MLNLLKVERYIFFYLPVSIVLSLAVTVEDKVTIINRDNCQHITRLLIMQTNILTTLFICQYSVISQNCLMLLW